MEFVNAELLSCIEPIPLALTSPTLLSLQRDTQVVFVLTVREELMGFPSYCY